MSRLFYPKLASSNIQKNSRFYFPYILTCIFTIAMFYNMCMLTAVQGMEKLPGSDSLSTIMGFGTYVIAFFSIIFLFYTNSFLMKRRKKEIGLFNILGMEKKHIAKVLFWESLFTFTGSIVLGLSLGILLSKLSFLALFKLLPYSVPITFTVNTVPIIFTVLLFSGIFLLTLIYNLLQIKLSKPIELLKGGNVGEKEPKAKWLLALIGVITLGAGYTIALVIESPLQALVYFFIAVILVIIGTYCLFTAGSIALLKLLKKNKGYYYKPNHFISISGMIYRMKQNAVGLANICILSTMVLVMISTTVSLYVGVEDALDYRYPYDVEYHLTDPSEEDMEKAFAIVTDTAKSYNLDIENSLSFRALSFVATRDGNVFELTEPTYINQANAAMLTFFTEDEYEKLTGQTVDLEKDQVLAYGVLNQLKDNITLFGKTYEAIPMEKMPIEGESNALLVDSYYMVVKDQSMIDEIGEKQKAVYGENASSVKGNISVNLSGTGEEKLNYYYDVKGKIQSQVDEFVSGDSREAGEEDFYAFYGGFLFLGLFLGLIFIVATVLIMYYKQISEGYDDKVRFEIMQKVGMSRDEVKKSIKTQVLQVFFLPLVMAIIHIAFAFKMIVKLLAVLNLTNVSLFVLCTVITILAFALIYGIVYSLTAKVYYRIVS